MERRFTQFLILSCLFVAFYMAVMAQLNPRKQIPKPDAVARQENAKQEGGAAPAGQEKAAEKDQNVAAGSEKNPADKNTDGPAEKEVVGEKNATKEDAVLEKTVPEQWLTLGSLDDDSPYRMLVTLTNKGGAIARVEMSNPRYSNVDDRFGYLGNLVVGDEGKSDGCPVQIVGPGTPAAEAGLKVGDLITRFNDVQITSSISLNAALKKTKPKQNVSIIIKRDGEEKTLSAKLRRIPLDVIQPEKRAAQNYLQGYLGKIVLNDAGQTSGCPVQIVEPGSAAADAGLKVGDTIVEMEGLPIATARALRTALLKTRPNQTVALTVKRNDEKVFLKARLGLVPIDAMKIDAYDPLSFLMTLRQIDDTKLAEDSYLGDGEKMIDDETLESILKKELPGVSLRQANWEVISKNEREAVFCKKLQKYGLEVHKTYRLMQVPEKSIGDIDYKGYHLEFEIKIVNASDVSRKIGYRLDGPTGLPTEGAWYANKVSRTWGGGGLRDVVFSLDQATPVMKTCYEIADNALTCKPVLDPSLSFIAVDAQYFAAALIPQMKDTGKVWFVASQPLRVGPIDIERKNLTDVTFRLNSSLYEIKPGESLAHTFDVFAGPKRPAVLENYKLGGLVYYGWFGWVAEPMLKILHGFYAVIPNYGIAIILLTVLVRGCMFPMSRKQALGTQKMQEIQPEMKRIMEKYKKDLNARQKAIQELYRKHNHNPFSGCLPIFVQLPIFLGLYRSLMVDVELRDAPLISHAVRWCSNLAAPDMLFNWSPFMPDFINNGVGMFGLGQFFNILPILTIFLFLWQQKKMMPPPTDEQQATQQKVMKYMMYFMALMFYKVASGLCLYFIASTLWGLGERKFLPKTQPPKPLTTKPQTAKPVTGGKK